MAVDTRRSSLTSVHNYNLRNQGWPRQFNCATTEAGDDATLVDPVYWTREKIGVYPSNADVIFLAKVSSAQRPNAIGAYSPWQLRNFVFGNTPAAKGHFVINAFNRNRQAVANVAGIYKPERDKDEDRPISVEFYAGRVWYLMPDGRLYYSQILTDLSKAHRCYQESDPTAEDLNQVVATDGGWIELAGVTQGLNLLTVQKELVVFADNGIWSIAGEGDETFTAVSQDIRKITSVGVSGKESSVVADGVLYYWANGGIYILQENQVSGLLEAVNITETTIQTFYTSLSENAKKHCKAFYDEREKKIIWLYNDTAAYRTATTFLYRYNRALIFDTILQAFYTYSFDSTSTTPFVSMLIQKEDGSTENTTNTVVSGSDTVVSGSDNVISTTRDPVVSELSVQAIGFAEQTTDTYRYLFTEFLDDTFVDWKQFDGTGFDYVSHAESGEDVVGDLLTEKELNQVYTFFEQTEQNFVDNNGIQFDKPSGCQMRVKWDWSDSATSNRWSESEQVYRLREPYLFPSAPSEFDYGFAVVQTINQVRGRGRSFRIRFESESGKDFHLLGWAMQITGMTAP